MSGYLAAVVDGVLGREPVLVQRRPSPFEPAPGAGARVEKEGLEEIASFEESASRSNPPVRGSARPTLPAALDRLAVAPPLARPAEPLAVPSIEPAAHAPATVPMPVPLREEPRVAILRERSVPAPVPPAPPVAARQPAVILVTTESLRPLAAAPALLREPPRPILQEPPVPAVIGPAERTVIETATQREASRGIEERLRESASPPGAPESAAPAGPAPIHVSIGRIEVRATAPAAPSRRSEGLARPKQDLDAYLKTRTRGSS